MCRLKLTYAYQILMLCYKEVIYFIIYGPSLNRLRSFFKLPQTEFPVVNFTVTLSLKRIKVT